MSCRMVSAPPASTTRPITHLDRLLLDQRRDEARVLGDGAVVGVFLCEVTFARGLAVCFGCCERHLVHVLGLLFLPVRRISDQGRPRHTVALPGGGPACRAFPRAA